MADDSACFPQGVGTTMPSGSASATGELQKEKLVQRMQGVFPSLRPRPVSYISTSKTSHPPSQETCVTPVPYQPQDVTPASNSTLGHNRTTGGSTGPGSVGQTDLVPPTQDEGSRRRQDNRRRSLLSLFHFGSKPVAEKPPAKIYVPTHAASDFSANSVPDERHLLLEKSLSHVAIRDRGASRSSSSTADNLDTLPESDSSDGPDAIRETRRILESFDKPENRPPQRSTRGRPRGNSSQQIADSRVLPDNFSDFQRTLQQAIASNPILREQIWLCMLQGVNSRTGTTQPPELDGNLSNLLASAVRDKGQQSWSNHRQPQDLASSTFERSSRRGGADTARHHHHGSSWKRQGWLSNQQAQKRDGKSQSGGGHAALRHDNSKKGHAIVKSPEKKSDKKMDEKQRKLMKRSSCGSNYTMQTAPADKRTSISSFSDFLAGYMKPTMPATIDDKAQPHPGFKRLSLQNAMSRN